MDWIVVIAALICGWALLSIVGGEYQRKLYELATRVEPDPESKEPIVEEPIVVGAPASHQNQSKH
jgi:hypothetical protein